MPTADAILTAAERICREEGLAALSLRRVAQSVGVTPMALYHHYPNKDALLDAIVARGFAMLETYLAVTLKHKSASRMLRAFLGRYRDFALDHPRIFELMFLTPRPSVPLASDSLRASDSEAFRSLLTTLDTAIARGDLCLPTSADVVLLAWSTAHGLIVLHLSGRFGHDRNEFSRAYDRTIRQQVGLLGQVRSLERSSMP